MIYRVSSTLDDWVTAVEMSIEDAAKFPENRELMTVTVTFRGRTAEYRVDLVEETFEALHGVETRTFHLSPVEAA